MKKENSKTVLSVSLSKQKCSFSGGNTSLQKVQPIF